MYNLRIITRRSGVFFLISAVAFAFPTVRLTDAARKDWNNYVQSTESQMGRDAQSHHLRALDGLPELRAKVLSGAIVAVPFPQHRPGGSATVNISDGIINHWLGAVFIPGATVGDVEATLQDYPAYPRIYAPDVAAAKVLDRQGGNFDIAMRLFRRVKVKVLFGYNFPVEFNANFHVSYFDSGDALQVRSISTRIGEVKNPEKSHDVEYPLENDDGYLWRLNTYWRIYEGSNGSTSGTFAECEVVSLSRAVPGFVQKSVAYFTTNLPEESMRSTLQATREEAARKGHMKPAALRRHVARVAAG